MSSHPPEADAAPVLELAEVSFRRGQRTILHDITFTVNAGEHWALIGPNGAGKSTILSMCGASNHPTSGTVRVLGDQLGRVELQALRRSIGHVNPRHPLNSPLCPSVRWCSPASPVRRRCRHAGSPATISCIGRTNS